MTMDVIITRTKTIESALVKLGASGKGLHEKASSLEGTLAPSLVMKIRFIASVRNKSLHDDDYSVSTDTLTRFLRACEEVENQLSCISQSTSKTSPRNSASSPSKGVIEEFQEASTLGKIGIVAGATLALFMILSGK